MANPQDGLSPRLAQEAWLCSCNGTVPLPRPADLPEGLRLRGFRLLCRQDLPAPEAPVFVGCARGTGRLLADWEAQGLSPGRVVAWDLPPALVGRPGAATRRLAAAAAAAGTNLAAAALPPAERELPPLPRVAVLGPGGLGVARTLAGVAEVVWIAPGARPGRGWNALPAQPVRVDGRAGAFRIGLAVPHPVDPWSCVGCGACAQACPTGALDPELRFSPERCDGCGRCEAACGPAAALDLRRPPAVAADQVIWPGGTDPPRPGLFLPAGPDGVSAAIVEALALAAGTVAWDTVGPPPEACAHRAARLGGCSRCLEVCPTGALRDRAGSLDRDPLACSGCGACVAACPTGQMDSRPWPRDALAQALESLGRAGIPLHLRCRHAEEAGGPQGAVGVPLDHLAGLDAWGLAGAVLAGSPWLRLTPCPTCEPVAQELREECDRVLDRVGLGGTILLVGNAPASGAARRPPLPPGRPAESTLARRARILRALWDGAPDAPDLDGPFGRPEVGGGCTACGACAGVCPTGALEAEPNTPVLRVTEVRCVGCGLCAAACPEAALGIERRLRWARESFAPRVLVRADAHACPACGRVFATREAIEAVVDRLRSLGLGDPELLALCPDCRAVRALAEGPRPGEAGS